ncbi:hypothetical protein SDC9_126664 [bioreactor metagenome]|uniref:Uncharacterized protein n=1 Tax=bioreactor metagenome TaxID=1076179 RepID=A0A645CRU9_9ZZZZ
MQEFHAEATAIILRLRDAAFVENAAGKFRRDSLAAQKRIMVERREHNFSVEIEAPDLIDHLLFDAVIFENGGFKLQNA